MISTALYVGRVFQRVNKTDSCWEWVSNSGDKLKRYPEIAVNGASISVNRIVFEAITGVEIPKGIMLYSLCKNIMCVNPGHMERVSSVELGKRIGENYYKTFCKRGHSLCMSNLRPRNKRRCCALCDMQWTLYKRLKKALILGHTFVPPSYFKKCREPECVPGTVVDKCFRCLGTGVEV